MNLKFAVDPDVNLTIRVVHRLPLGNADLLEGAWIHLVVDCLPALDILRAELPGERNVIIGIGDLDEIRGG